MRKYLSILFVAAFALGTFALSAADLTIDYQVNTVAQDYAGNYLTFQGKAASAVKDQLDAVSGASKLESTAMFNVYRFDIYGGKLLPGGLRSFFLYPVADDATRTTDGLNVVKNADGSITVRYVHRGTANQFSTDAAGNLALPMVVKTRKIGHTDGQISTDFSASGKAVDVDWAKVWDASVADGKVVGKTTSKTGPIAYDFANSAVTVWTGILNFTFDGTILKVKGGLNAAASTGLSLGLGKSPIFRSGPGSDETKTPVYSFTYVYGSVIFDVAGKIVDLEMDELEVSSPNYDGASMPHFAGWPGTPGYNVVDHATKKVVGPSANTVESTTADVLSWKSKRERGDAYGMNAKNDWWKQMDAYEKQFIGKTVDEVEAWYKKYSNDKNGRPLNPAATDAAEKAKYAALDEAGKQIVADVRSGATMSINDPHGYVLIAIRDAWNKRKPLGAK